jgi:hypothetical protein
VASTGKLVQRWSALLAILALAICAAPFSASAQEAKPQPPVDDGWHFTAAPYAWAFGIKGDVGTGNRHATVDDSFLDIVQKTNSLAGIQGHIEARRDRFGLFLDGLYINLTASDKVSASNGVNNARLKVNVDMQMAIVEAGLFYRLVDRYQLWQPPPGIDGGGTFIFDALAGARYTYLDLSPDAKANVDTRSFKRDANGSRDWVDPFIGGRIMLALSNSVDFSLRGDVGGFSVGSTFTWNTQALLGYRFTLLGASAEAWGGYRALAQNYDEGPGRKDLKWDVIMHGPVIGMSVTW